MTSLRTFRAASVADALALVRRELGQEALILGQREVRRRRFPWQRVQVETELTAAIGPHRVTEPTAADVVQKALSIRDAVPESPPNVEAEPSTGPVVESTSPNVTVKTPSVDPFRIYTRLIEQDVDETDAREIVVELRRRMASRQPLSDLLATIVRDMLPCSGAISVHPGRQRVVALVGPTGVGKTTTVAKLAANFRLKELLRVGLITVDTYRVAAVDQLQTYANLIDVPMRVVKSPREMRQAIDDLSSMDLVLIDTAGRSPQDELKIQELRGFLQAAQADEVHLVVSLNAARRSLDLTAERFQQVGPTSVLLTKLDEAPGAGAVLSAARRTSLPISYLTTGQDVPEDIEAADTERLIPLILGTELSTDLDEFGQKPDSSPRPRDDRHGEHRSSERMETEVRDRSPEAELRLPTSIAATREVRKAWTIPQASQS